MKRSRSPKPIAAAALLLALTACAGGPARTAQDSLYHTGENGDAGALQESSVLRAARAAPVATLTAEQRQTLDAEFRIGQNNDFGAASARRPEQAIIDYPRVASTVPMVGGKRDLLGDGGAQDELARQMFPLGAAPVGGGN